MWARGPSHFLWMDTPFPAEGCPSPVCHAPLLLLQIPARTRDGQLEDWSELLWDWGGKMHVVCFGKWRILLRGSWTVHCGERESKHGNHWLHVDLHRPRSMDHAVMLASKCFPFLLFSSLPCPLFLPASFPQAEVGILTYH